MPRYHPLFIYFSSTDPSHSTSHLLLLLHSTFYILLLHSTSIFYFYILLLLHSTFYILLLHSTFHLLLIYFSLTDPSCSIFLFCFPNFTTLSHHFILSQLFLHRFSYELKEETIKKMWDRINLQQT